MLTSESYNTVKLVSNIDDRCIKHVGEVAVRCEACKKFDAVCLGDVARLPSDTEHEHFWVRR